MHVRGLGEKEDVAGNNPASLVQRTGPAVAVAPFRPDQTCQGEGICGHADLLALCPAWENTFSGE